MAADLAHDGRNSERDEVRTGLDVEARHGVDQTHPRDLNQVVAQLAASLEPASDVIRQRQAPFDDLVFAIAEIRRPGFVLRQLPKHVADIGILRAGT